MHAPRSSPSPVVRTNGVELCTQSFGDPDDPPILLIMAAGASMLWWDDTLCRRLADAGRFVVRYDHRDTGRSTTFPPGRRGYTAAELVTDAVGVLDGYGITAAHLVGVSTGGVIAQFLALDHAQRVRSLTLISTTPAAPGDRVLPPPTAAFERFVANAQVDWSDRESVIRYRVAYCRVLAGDRPFDEPAITAFVRRDAERAHDIAAAQNHDLIAEQRRPRRALSSIAVPTLVIHGTADPMFPLPHGVALAEEIPTAGLQPLAGAGHGIDPADWDLVIAAIRTYTSPAGLPTDPRMQQ
jgi:pimeloyl-ACP methyl ester carboxylesterase